MRDAWGTDNPERVGDEDYRPGRGEDSGWKQVVYAANCTPCDECDEPICPLCEDHYSECECPGPSMEDHEYREINGILYARPYES